MSKKKQGTAAVRRWIGVIMCLVGAGATAFFVYARAMGLGTTMDEAGNVTGGSGSILLILASLLLLAKGIQVVLTKDKKTDRRKFRINLPDI